MQGVDLWDLWARGMAVVIPTNTTRKANGEAIMGAGLAKQAQDRMPDLPRVYGDHLSRGEVRVVLEALRVILLPTKQDWRKPAQLPLIEEGLRWMVGHERLRRLGWEVAVPPLGCGLGTLRWDDQVRPLMERYLDERFVVVLPGGRSRAGARILASLPHRSLRDLRGLVKPCGPLDDATIDRAIREGRRGMASAGALDPGASAHRVGCLGDGSVSLSHGWYNDGRENRVHQG